MRPHPRADLAVVGAAVLVFLLTLFTIPDLRCSTAAPCDAEPVTSLGIGLLAAVAVTTFLHRWAAAALAVACLGLWAAADRADDAGLEWRAALPVLLVVTTVVVARLRHRIEPDDAPRRRPPRPLRIPVRTGALVGGLLLLAVSLAGITATLRQQQRVTAQEAGARSVTAVVHGYRDEDTVLTVQTPDGRLDIDVLAATDYPIGTPVELLVDDDGLRQLRSEPYDITWLLLPLTVGAGAGLALIARAGTRHRALRRLFDHDRPFRPVRAMETDQDDVFVLIPGPDGRARQFCVDYFDGPENGPLDDHPGDTRISTRPATLYGSPQTGSWCVVELDGHVYVPRLPVDEVEEVAYDGARGLPTGIDDDGEPAAGQEDLRPVDRDLTIVHEFSPVSAGAWGKVLLTGLAGVFTVPAAVHWIAPGLPDPVMIASIVVSALGGLEIGWRHRIRPRLRWNLGGVTAVTPWTIHRLAWTPQSGVSAGGTDAVVVRGDRIEVEIEVPGGASHDVDRLVAALRYARRAALDSGATVQPPAPPVPSRLKWAYQSR
ncbi:hypothetical protein [Actinoplanes sp. G11-F43]|uniref:hypothetical protein n=1 Tax=Actinoplanes sp. G11-F43 TaxID=3424130 RepID=UPI003D34BBF2